MGGKIVIIFGSLKSDEQVINALANPRKQNPKPTAQRAKNQPDFTSEFFMHFEIAGTRYLWNWRWKSM